MSTQPKPRVLTGEEKESCLIWNEADKTVQVGVYTPRWIKHFEEKLDLKPDDIDTNTKDGCRFYTMPKSWLRLPRRPRRLKPEQRARLAKAGSAVLARLRKGS